MVEVVEDASGANGASTSSSASQIPIAQLSPNVTTPVSIKAVVSLIWPYSSVTNSAALLLAEPDFRLRRDRGQVRVRFSGSSGRAVASSRIGSGDLVILNLEGVEWAKEDSSTRTPGRGIEWELRYAERLLLEIHHEETQTTSVLDIDHPAPIAEPSTSEPTVIASDVVDPPTPFLRSRKASDLESENPEEWKSPAFIKRARTSYGSLFGSSDIFAEDGSVKGKGRKRTKVEWRYTSRSPSPISPTSIEAEVEDETSAPEASGNALPQIPVMTDEGCQTIDDEGAFVERSRSGIEQLDPASVPATRPSDFSIAKTQSEVSTFQDTPRQEDWAAIDVGLLDQGVSLNGPQLSSGYPPVSAPTASFIHSHTEEDLYGEGSARDQADQDGLPSARTVFGDDLQSPSMTGLSFSDQYGSWQSAMATNDQPPGSISPGRPQEYPSPTDAVIQDAEENSPSQPYYENHGVPELLQDTINAYDAMHPIAPPHIDLNGSRKPSISSHQSHHSSARQTPSVQLPQGSLSRSQSAPREVFDLTGSSDEDGDADSEDELGEGVFIEDQANDGGRSNGSDAESEEEDEVDEYERHTRSWRRGLQTEIPEGQVYDEEDDYDSDPQRREYESGEEYEEDQYYQPDRYDEYDENDEEEEDEDEDEDDVSVDGVRPAVKGEAPVISLLSSDEEDGDEGYHVGPQSSAVDKSIEVPDLESSSDEYSGESEEGDLSDQDKKDGADNQKEIEIINFRASSRASTSGPTDLLGEEAPVQPHMPQKQAVEKPLEGRQQRSLRLMSFDGAADTFDDAKPIESDKVNSSSQARVTIERDDIIRVPLEKEVRDLDAEASKVASGHESDLRTMEITDTEIDKTVPEVIKSSPMDSIKAQILEILSDQSPPTEILPLASDHRDVEKRQKTEPERMPIEEGIEDKIEITVESQVTVTESTSGELPEHLDDVEMTENSLYPQLPLDGIEEGQLGLYEDALKISDLASKIQQLPTPADTQITATALSFEATQSSVTGTQVTQMTSTKTSFGATTVDEAPIPIPNAEEDVAPTIPLVEENQYQVDESAVESDSNDIIIEKETILMRSKRSVSETKKIEMAIDTHASPEPQSLPVTPRRSQRQASKALNSPKPLVTLQQEALILDESLSPAGYDASAELALASFNSPPKRDIDNISQTSATSPVPAHLKMSLKTDRGEYTILKNLRIKQGRKPDILAIATTASLHVHQAKKPPKDWFTDFHITDASVNPGVVTRVSVFRPHLEALPIVDPGDGLLLRNFKVQHEKNMKFSLRSESDSSWAVFKADGSVEMRGPPVESGDEEINHVASLKEWFNAMPAPQREVLEKAHGRKADKGKGVQRVK